MDLTKFEGHTPGPWSINNRPMYQAAWPDWVQPINARSWPAFAATVKRMERGSVPDSAAANAALIAAAPELLQEVTRLRAKAEELRQVLREVEWKGWPVMGNVGPMAACVSCGQLRAIGHDETCRLAAALNDSKEENDGQQ